MGVVIWLMTLTWIEQNPAEAAWYAFAALSALALVYGRLESRLKTWAGRSDTTVDDKLVWGLSHTIGLLTIVLDLFRELAPTFIGAQSGSRADALAEPDDAEADTDPDDEAPDEG